MTISELIRLEVIFTQWTLNANLKPCVCLLKGRQLVVADGFSERHGDVFLECRRSGSSGF